MKQLFAALCLVALSFVAMAGEARPLATDPIAEKRLQSLAEELRCLVCQNQSIADSNADLANDLKREVRSMIQQGKSDREIIDFMVTRYGDFVLYKPPVKATTLLLWAGPALFLCIGLVALFTYLRRRARLALADDAPLSVAEAERAQQLLKDACQDPPSHSRSEERKK